MDNTEKKNYSKTVNLPKTQFSMKANLPVMEPKIIEHWNKSKTYAKILNKSDKQFVLHDGPPYANGVIHIGHALNKILKDIVVKYKSMRGYSTPYVPGWDCHGLPIEHQLFKELKISKRQIDKVEFRKKAKEFAMKFVNIQRDEFIRLGILGQWDNPYLTMTNDYEATIIKIFGQLVEKGFIYRSKKPIYWCTTCETALADAEVEYADHVSHSVFVKFQVTDSSLSTYHLPLATYVLIWTTTPWTLPANVAIAFNKDEKYVLVKTSRGNLIIAQKLLKTVMEKIKDTDYSVLKEFSGKDLEQIKCKNPLLDRESTGVLADFVSMEDGTGVVHIAPGHGADDYHVGLKYKLPVISPVDDRGMFTDEVPDFKGQKVFDANPLIIEKLNSTGALVFEDKLTHSYPHCWRCKHAVIFRATYQWFMNIEHNALRKALLDTVKNVQWVPEYGIKRITAMLENRPDWCLSRQRHWGVPIPAVYCEKCGEVMLNKTIIDNFEKFTAQESADCWFIRPIEDFLPKGFTCKCGENKFKKENDIFDVWFDSGVSHEAVLTKNSNFNLHWPADIYLEGSDQHRGWFQTSLIPSVALHSRAPYNTVLTHGFVVDGDGKKMSKSQGNVVAPQEIIKNFGAEILRLWVSSSDYSEDIRISKEIIQRLVETYRKIRNTIRFTLGNLSDYDTTANKVPYEKLLEVDKWMLLRLTRLNKEVTKSYDNYEFHQVIYLVNNFCVLDLSGFYLDILKDRLYTFGANSPERRSAQTVLFEILTTLLKLVSPILSFTAEEAWQTLRQESKNINETSDSIFAEIIPEINEKYFSQQLLDDWTKLLELKEKTNLELETARKANIIGSSLDAKLIFDLNPETYTLLKKYEPGIPEVFIVSQVELKTASDTKSENKAVVTPADGTKCPRCWNFSTRPDAEGLCPKCKTAVEAQNL
ncbi:MAG: isoleucine--tRNA ligase [Elusimicrobia bacterium RIFOXYA2_FULL_39_19]|nr:MAG: isoleucine--tRNA ligase [Elusimicrobia bacterium RIFOXYA2_FULL_39_19]